MAKPKTKTREYVESLIIAAIIAFFVRSFFIQAFKIPSSSMEPTLLIGDHLLVNRMSYLVKVPFTDIVMFELGKPEEGRGGGFQVSRGPEQRLHKEGHRHRG